MRIQPQSLANRKQQINQLVACLLHVHSFIFYPAPLPSLGTKMAFISTGYSSDLVCRTNGLTVFNNQENNCVNRQNTVLETKLTLQSRTSSIQKHDPILYKFIALKHGYACEYVLPSYVLLTTTNAL